MVLLVPSRDWPAVPTLTRQTAHTSLPCGQKHGVSQLQRRDTPYSCLPQVTLQGLPGEGQSGEQRVTPPRPRAMAREIKIISESAPRLREEASSSVSAPPKSQQMPYLGQPGHTSGTKTTPLHPKAHRCWLWRNLRRIGNWGCFRILLSAFLGTVEDEDPQVILGDAAAEGHGGVQRGQFHWESKKARVVGAGVVALW